MKVLHEKKTNRMQLITTLILIVVVAGLLGGLFLVRQSLDIRERAAAPSCNLYDGMCSWTPVSGVTSYRIVVTGSDGTTQEFTSAGSSITFAGLPGTSYTCRVTALDYENSECDPSGEGPSGEGTGFCPLETTTEVSQTATVIPTVTEVSVTATPEASVTQSGLSVTPPLGGQADPTPTMKAGSTATPTPTTIVIQKSTTVTPTTSAVGGGSSVTSTQASSKTATPTTVKSLPQSGLWEPSLILLGIGLLAILIPLFL